MPEKFEVPELYDINHVQFVNEDGDDIALERGAQYERTGNSVITIDDDFVVTETVMVKKLS